LRKITYLLSSLLEQQARYRVDYSHQSNLTWKHSDYPPSTSVVIGSVPAARINLSHMHVPQSVLVAAADFNLRILQWSLP